MENHDYLSCRKEIREWEFGRGLLNGWATVFGAAALLTILGRIVLQSGQYRITVVHLGILLLLALAVCRLVWWRWHGKRTGTREFVRLEEEGIRYCLSGAGEGFVAYEWLQFVNLRGGNFPSKLLLQYRMPEQAGGVPQTLSLNLNRIKPLSESGNRVWLNGAGNALALAEEIRNRCRPGQLYGKLGY